MPLDGLNRVNTDVTPQAIRSIAKSLMKRDGAKEPTASHGPFALTFIR
jgi:hypothetical protein